MYFFVRYFVFEFVFKAFNPVQAFLISFVGLFLLLRILTLYVLTSFAAGGSVT